MNKILIKECWMRDLDYEDYVMYCNKHWVVAMSKETYYEMCSSYDDEMQAYMDADYEKRGV